MVCNKLGSPASKRTKLKLWLKNQLDLPRFAYQLSHVRGEGTPSAFSAHWQAVLTALTGNSGLWTQSTTRATRSRVRSMIRIRRLGCRDSHCEGIASRVYLAPLTVSVHALAFQVRSANAETGSLQQGCGSFAKLPDSHCRDSKW